MHVLGELRCDGGRGGSGGAGGDGESIVRLRKLCSDNDAAGLVKTKSPVPIPSTAAVNVATNAPALAALVARGAIGKGVREDSGSCTRSRLEVGAR